MTGTSESAIAINPQRYFEHIEMGRGPSAEGGAPGERFEAQARRVGNGEAILNRSDKAKTTGG